MFHLNAQCTNSMYPNLHCFPFQLDGLNPTITQDSPTIIEPLIRNSFLTKVDDNIQGSGNNERPNSKELLELLEKWSRQSRQFNSTLSSDSAPELEAGIDDVQDQDWNIFMAFSTTYCNLCTTTLFFIIYCRNPMENVQFLHNLKWSCRTTSPWCFFQLWIWIRKITLADVGFQSFDGFLCV